MAMVTTTSKNVWSNKSLDSTGGSPIPGRQLQVWTTDLNNPNQKWVITSVTGGAYMLRNVGTGLVVDLSAGIAQNGRPIDGYLANGTTAQQWRLDKLNDPISRFDDAADATRGLVKDGIYEIEPMPLPESVWMFSGRHRTPAHACGSIRRW